MASWLWWVLDGFNPVSWYRYLTAPSQLPLRLDNIPKGHTLMVRHITITSAAAALRLSPELLSFASVAAVQAAETLTYVLELSPALSGWLQQLGAAGSGVQSRVEIAVSLMSGGLSSLSLVADSADSSERLISLGHSAAAQQVTLCLDRVNSAMFTPRCWFVNIIADSSGCKLTLAARVATITTVTTDDGRKAVQEQHVHLPAMMQHGVDGTINAVVDRERERKDRQEGKVEPGQQQQQGIAAAGQQGVDDDAYRRMEEAAQV